MPLFGKHHDKNTVDAAHNQPGTTNPAYVPGATGTGTGVGQGTYAPGTGIGHDNYATGHTTAPGGTAAYGHNTDGMTGAGGMSGQDAYGADNLAGRGAHNVTGPNVGTHPGAHGVHGAPGTTDPYGAAGVGNATIPHAGTTTGPHSSTAAAGHPSSMAGKIEKAAGTLLGSNSLKTKGLQKEQEGNALKLQSAELSEAERLEREATMRRERAVAHGAHPEHRHLGGGADLGPNPTGMGNVPGQYNAGVGHNSSAL
jgi:hypothetical protein